MTILCRSVSLSDATSVSEARRAVRQVAEALAMDEVKAGQAAVVVTEAARNAVVHGREGQLLLSGEKSDTEARMQIMAIDRGPGISDLPRAMVDGFSTSSTPGTGLGAIRRMAGTFDIFSTSKGTAVLAEIVQQAPAADPLLDIAGLAVPLSGEACCGDAIEWVYANGRLAALLVDGLGHGLHAADAAQEAVHIFRRYSTEPPREILAYVHDALKKTRGAAAAVVEVRPLSGTLAFAGIGNISAVLMSKTLSRSLVSHSGTLGHIMRRIQEFKMEWPRDAVLVMHSDGLHTRWDLSHYPGILARSAGIIAAVLFRDFRRERDDASVLVLKNRSSAL